MKRVLLLSALFLSSLAGVQAQNYGNEWINYSQQYFKMKVWQEGVYRVSRQSLLFAGIPVTNIDPRKFQIYRNGIEQHIHIEGEGDGTFDANDFIEFYGQPNDGSFDTQLFADPALQANPYFSQFTDTAVYFLTWSATVNGKRMTTENDNNFGAYNPADYVFRESFFQQNYGYNRGMNSQSIEYTESESWCGAFGNYTNGTLTVPMNTANIFNGGPDIRISTAISGINNLPHNINISFPGTNYSETYYTQMLKKYTFTAAPSTFTGPTTNFVYSVTTPAATPDYNSFYYLSVRYPHTLDFENTSAFTFEIGDNPSQPKSRLDVTNFNGGAAAPLLYDLTNHKRITVFANGAGWQALVPNDAAADPKKCHLVSQNNIQNLTSIQGINYVSNNFGYFNNIRLTPVDSAFIIVTNRVLWSEALTYKAHRDFTSGNRTLMVDIDELTDQFAYGIQKHPMSIKNFSRYLLDNWTTVGPPQHLFLIGKSISPADFRFNPSYFELSMVPSYGVPTSDMLLTSGINGSLYEPKIPVGRLCARNGADIIEYLKKVQEYEAAQAGPPQPWMKEILHFGGGNDLGQQAQLGAYLDSFKVTMQNPYFGGHVTTYLKFNTNPIVINQSDSLQAQIDSGVAVMTFFGHASGSGFDQSTDEPSEYGNKGRYPLVVANSCFAGDIHAFQKSVSEKFVLEPEKAAIGFIASVGQGVPQDLFLYSGAFFDHASNLSYGATIGQLMRKAIETIQVPNAENIKTVCHEMSLNGDPSLRLNGWQKPDYSISESSIRFTPSSITTDLDTFSIRVTTRNIAKAVTDSFNVHITRIFPDGADSVYTIRTANCFYSDEVVVTLNTGGFGAAGVNRFIVYVDQEDSVDEYDNITNNMAMTSLFITSNDIIPVYPPKYAVHPFNTVTLKASTANPLAGSTNYRFEIDTVDLNLADAHPGSIQQSPLFRFTVMTDSGGVLSWSPPGYILRDSTVYFWRVANDSVQYDPLKYKWQQSSFQYIAGKTGWSQSHFHQFQSDVYENILYDTLGRQFEFIQNNKVLSVLTKGSPDGTQTGYNEIGYKLNNVAIEYNGCGINPAVMVAVLDSITLQPWNTCGNDFGQTNRFFVATGSCSDPLTVSGTGTCRSRPENFFIFRYGDPAQMQGLSNLINSVPNGNYILAYSWYTTAYSAVDPLFWNTFNGLGYNLAGLQDNTPYILFNHKGRAGSNLTVFGSNITDTLTLSTLLSSVWNRGTVTSEIIGPARNWHTLHWNQIPAESTAGEDIIHLNLYGLNRTTLKWDTLSTGITYAPTGKDTTLNWIPASTYSYLRLQSYKQDDSLRTPPQMTYWRIYYDEVPECAINPNNVFEFYRNPISEGDTIRLSVSIDNVGNLPMDSLSVDFYLYDAGRQRRNIQTVKLDSLRVNQFLIANVVVDSTFGLAGNNSLWIEANPFNADHQQEQYHFNNLAEIKFRMDRDVVNPILDVTFDGIHILDRDIVSGKPNIVIQLQDENRFLALNDTSKFKVYIKSPGSNTLQRVYFSNPLFGEQMRFTPANLPKNSCRIDWNPVLQQDGIYTLEVEATDMSNNESGKFNYKISFEVVNKSTITEVLNYPNPFSTSTRFVFTLTGNEVPTYMKIQIITISGKIVREIMLNELGNIHVGRNITDYAWDGKDEFGDQLANGLYLYRVITSIDGESIEKRETDADQYFKKGWGKMYLIR